MYDVIIIGGGVSGLSAGIFTAKAGLSTAILDNGKSQITRVSTVQNIPGVKEGISGKEWIKQAKAQVSEFGGTIINDTAIKLAKKEDGTFEVTTENEAYAAKYVVVATNANKELIEGFGFEEKTNSLVPSGKAKSIPNIPWTGETGVENLYLAGLITEIPSQLSVALGQGAAVGITIASKEIGKAYMWHDV